MTYMFLLEYCIFIKIDQSQYMLFIAKEGSKRFEQKDWSSHLCLSVLSNERSFQFSSLAILWL